MKTATYLDAVQIGGILDLDPDSVWEIIKGMKFSWYTELDKAVENALSESGGHDHPEKHCPR